MENNTELSPTEWYPAPPPDYIPPANVNDIRDDENQAATGIWVPDGILNYTTKNIWPPSIPCDRIESCRRMKPPNVEARNLPKNHFLCGEKGLFAIAKFSRYDIVGEYTGKIVDDTAGGRFSQKNTRCQT